MMRSLLHSEAPVDPPALATVLPTAALASWLLVKRQEGIGR
jgi:hypothetical protein